MAKSLNRACLLGIVGKDPEVRHGASGNAVVSFSMATNEKYRDKSGEYVDKTTWHNISAFGKLAEIIEKYVRKGSRLYLEGSIDNQQYEKDGVTKYITKILARDMTLLSESPKGKSEKEKPSEPSIPDALAKYSNDLDDPIPF